MRKEQLVLLSITVLIILLWGGTWFVIGPRDDRGTLGDMFGAVNALFSGFAFLGVIYAILLQRNELSLQREELELTRKELKKSADAQEKSERALSIQAKAMEQTALINLLTASVQSLAARAQGLQLSGLSSVVESNMRHREILMMKHAKVTAKLDSLMEEVINS